MRYCIIFLFLFMTTTPAVATTFDFNNLSEGSIVSGSGVFNDFILDSPDDYYELNAIGGLHGKDPNDISILDIGSDTPPANEIRFTIDFIIDNVDFVSFDVGGNNEDAFGMSVRAYDADDNLLDSEGVQIDNECPPGDDSRIVDWMDADRNWGVNFRLEAAGIKSIEIEYYCLWFDLSLDNLAYGTSPIPEPATMILFGVGLLGIAGINRKKK